MATINRFEDLEIWKLSRSLSKEIFRLSQNGKLSKDYELKDQMNRSSGSIMDNIAEGFGRGSRLDFIQFLSIASATELKSQLYRCVDRNYISIVDFEKLSENANAVYKKINGFIKYLNTSIVKGTKFKDRLSK
ncbi:MAG TPA: four helix bundle protein [Ferruginibacter sp.]|nr:four helix bundle protein [Ferruginibacter sp.]HRE64932.1 four helix bundle protein [Ferruginibacter sp.]